jgi:DNA sulfur modification protein DndD
MILEQLTVRNLGLFRGRQVFDLSPFERHGKHRPIVLFGGINGGGKTTLFDGIQLALYGPRARCSKRAQLTYEDYLRESIHQGVAAGEGAGVALSFRYAAEGEEQLYEVRRDWRVEDGRCRETLVVCRDGLPNYSLARNWPQLVEELIPLEISQLFFFDGEKIRALAEDSSSSQALGAAVKTLLGLDLVERLIADATVLQARLVKEAGSPEQRAAVEALEQEQTQLDADITGLKQDQGALQNQRERAENELREAEATFAAGGGKHWQARQTRQERLAELTGLANELEAQLLTLAAGELPLALVPDLLDRVAEQDGVERQTAAAAIIHRLLADRDARLLEVLRAANVPPQLCRLVDDHLNADRQRHGPSGTGERRLDLSEGVRSLLGHLRGQRLAELRAEAGRILEKLGEVTQEREDLQRILAATPADGDVARLTERLKAATGRLAVLGEEAGRLEAELREAKARREACAKRLHAALEKQFEGEDAVRMAQLAGRTRTTMQEFLRQATARKIDRLSALITESFRFLLRKQTLVERILIDPATFAVTLYDAAGQALPRQRLSEGEKQIFAVAMLWGLAKAAARPLPAVIDTPMARLDAAHRQNLVERYFPNASHQVVIFSTDTEVDRYYYGMLQPAVARAYHLSYDDAGKATVGEEGYFWKE